MAQRHSSQTQVGCRSIFCAVEHRRSEVVIRGEHSEGQPLHSHVTVAVQHAAQGLTFDAQPEHKRPSPRLSS
eukprot:2633852-Prymnesium_polylepis.1